MRGGAVGFGLLLAHCGHSVIVDEREEGAATVSSSSASAMTSAASGGSSEGGCPAEPPCTIRECQGHVYDCGDCVDNDEDGLTDSDDPECLGSCQPMESSFYTGGICGSLVCSGAPCSVDCAFDADNGSGNDFCYWSHRCDSHEVPPDYYPEPEHGDACAYDEGASISGTTKSCAELRMTQSSECLGYCEPLTPNGCDCFGCCELPARSGNWVYIGSDGIVYEPECTSAAAGEPALCHPCDPVPSCMNPCDACELCIGETELAAGCRDQTCPAGRSPCGFPCQAPCGEGEYCISGCCVALPR